MTKKSLICAFMAGLVAANIFAIYRPVRKILKGDS
jgi:hypothetical protein